MSSYYSNGKLLLTGEYLVLEGATALALPTRLGQSLEVRPREEPGIFWKSLDRQGETWLEAHFSFQDGKLMPNPHKTPKGEEKALRRLLKILWRAAEQNPELLSENRGFEVLTRLDFDRTWGLGSSSTLINNIAQWFDIDAYRLLEQTFGGSGYDIASAQHSQPITYTRAAQGPKVFAAAFDPPFKDQLFFVHLNQKQDSRNSMAHFRSQAPGQLSEAVEKVNSITQRIIECGTLTEFRLLLEIHETLLSQILQLPKVKSARFGDFPGAVKSLGGWGGDFVLATGGEEEQEYFRSKGYSTIFDYTDLIL